MFVLLGISYECGGVSRDIISVFDSEEDAYEYKNTYSRAKETHKAFQQKATELAGAQQASNMCIQRLEYLAIIASEYQRLSGKSYAIEQERFCWDFLFVTETSRNKKFDPNE